ncbi:MAG: MmcQ/YjbR family DNA-binding protein [Clostridia bacterium]|nr:MmcQ/YjbR family DNA-binding protein [Clostridia bacterium]
MTQRADVIACCLTFPHAYEDYPFDDPNWTVMRRRDTKRGFAWIFEREGRIWVNLKAQPETVQFWIRVFPACLPAYHMNKTHWFSVILDGSVPEDQLEQMIAESHALCGRQKKHSVK